MTSINLTDKEIKRIEIYTIPFWSSLIVSGVLVSQNNLFSKVMGSIWIFFAMFIKIMEIRKCPQ